MLIGLFTLLSILLFGGGESPFEIPNARKILKNQVVDPDNLKRANDLFDAYETQWKVYNDVQKAQFKAFEKMIPDKTVHDALLRNEVKANRVERVKIVELAVDARMELITFLSEDEWSGIVKEAHETVEADRSKRIKKTKKAEEHLSKKFDALRASVSKHLATNKDSAIIMIDSFQNDIQIMLQKEKQRLPELVQMMSKHDTSREEWRAAAMQYEKFRTDVAHSFIDLREGLLKWSDDKTWPKLARDLKSFY